MLTTTIGNCKVPVLGQGTYGFGGKFSRNSKEMPYFVKSLRLGFDLGMTLVDTAEIYAEGESEHIVGKAMVGHIREDLFIATKVWKTNLSYYDVFKACKGSLKRLNTKYIDLYQVHWPNPTIPIRETMQAFEKLMSDGLIRGIGVSNFSVGELKEAQASLSKQNIISNQVPYSLDNREIESSVLPFCKHNKIAVIAYSPLKHLNMLSDRASKILGRLARNRKKTGAQIALNWLISKGTIPIPKATNEVHVKENAAAADFNLSLEEVLALDSV